MLARSLILAALGTAGCGLLIDVSPGEFARDAGTDAPADVSDAQVEDVFVEEGVDDAPETDAPVEGEPCDCGDAPFVLGCEWSIVDDELVCGAETCVPGRADCNQRLDDGCEVALGTDENNCGSCGYKCADHELDGTLYQMCLGGVCKAEVCAEGRASCDDNLANGCEVDTTTDPLHCGGCPNVCTDLPQVDSATCESSVCVIPDDGCAPDYADCSKEDPTDGCETDLRITTDHCGSCTAACGDANHTLPGVREGGYACEDSVCRVAPGGCAEGYADCELDPTEGCGPTATYYLSTDGDDYGTDASADVRCVSNPGEFFVSQGGDCYDHPVDPVSGDVHPDQLHWFYEPYFPAGARGTPSWDYDCSGGPITHQYTVGSMNTCSAARGFFECGATAKVWIASTVPLPGSTDFCGLSGILVYCDWNPSTLACMSIIHDDVQMGCH